MDSLKYLTTGLLIVCVFYVTRRRRSLPKAGWVGQLSHDISPYADWGWIRDEAGDLIMIVKPPSLSDAEFFQHTRNKTDPAQKRVDAVLRGLNGPNADRSPPARDGQ